jgi:hypothetical protein
MATVEEVARGVLASTGGTTDLVLASRWVAERYRQVAARARFRHLRHIGSVTLPASISAGTATATRGSATVAGNATAQAAWTPDVVGRWFRARTTWYEIVGVVGGELRLASEYAEETTAAAGYTIVARHVSLARDARHIGTMVHQRRHYPLEQPSLSRLNDLAPARTTVSGAGPTVASEVGLDEFGAKRFEFYPYNTSDEVILYIYWSHPPLLAPTDQVPPVVDEYILREGALIDAMRAEMVRALRAMPPQVEVAAVWRNDYRAQETKWDRYMIEASRHDRGVDDLELIFSSGLSRPGVGDIATARDHVLANWPR